MEIQVNVLSFNKEEDKWYIDLPDWKGDKAELQMVMGADDALDEISKGKDKVMMLVSLEPFDSSEAVELQRIEFDGATYLFREKEMWLCEVTLSVFGEFPGKFYIKVIS